VVVAGPLKELELADKHRLQPLAFRHLRLRQALTPSAASGLREIREWAFGDLKSLEPSEQLTACGRREAVASSRGVNELVPPVVAEGHQTVPKPSQNGFGGDLTPSDDTA
jgi:hypothetical protein